MAADFEDSQERIAAAAARSAEFQNAVRKWNMDNQMKYLPGILGQGKATADFYTNQPRTMFVSDRFQPQGVQEYTRGNVADMVDIDWNKVTDELEDPPPVTPLPVDLSTTTMTPAEYARLLSGGDSVIKPVIIEDESLDVRNVVDPATMYNPITSIDDDAGTGMTPADFLAFMTRQYELDEQIGNNPALADDDLRNLTLSPANNPALADDDMRNLALSPASNPALADDDMRNLAFSPANNPALADDDMRNLAFSPANNPMLADNDMRNLAFSPANNPMLADNDMRNLVSNPALADADMRNLVTNPSLADADMRNLISNPSLADVDMRNLVSNPSLADADMRNLVSNPALADADMRNLVTNPALADADMRNLVNNPALADADMRNLISNPSLADADMRNLVTNPSLADADMRNLISNPSLADTDLRNLVTNPSLADTDLRNLVSNPALADTDMRNLVTNPMLADADMRNLVTNPALADADMRNLVNNPALADTDMRNLGPPSLESVFERDPVYSSALAGNLAMAGMPMMNVAGSAGGGAAGGAGGSAGGGSREGIVEGIEKWLNNSPEGTTISGILPMSLQKALADAGFPVRSVDDFTRLMQGDTVETMTMKENQLFVQNDPTREGQVQEVTFTPQLISQLLQQPKLMAMLPEEDLIKLVKAYPLVGEKYPEIAIKVYETRKALERQQQDEPEEDDPYVDPKIGRFADNEIG